VTSLAGERLQAAGYVCRRPGADGLGLWVNRKHGLRLIHSEDVEEDHQLWGHVSLSRQDRAFPTWLQVRDANWLIYPDRAGVVVVAPMTTHVNLAEVAHVWTCLTADTVPDFTRGTAMI
jgi:hypothetical protein